MTRTGLSIVWEIPGSAGGLRGNPVFGEHSVRVVENIQKPQRKPNRQPTTKETNEMNRIPCAHETGDAPVSETVNNYHPLSRSELSDLLAKAANETGKNLADIQVRVGQGLPGLTCPLPVYGLVAKADAEINSTFVSFRRGKISHAEAVSRIHAIYSQQQVHQKESNS